MRRHPARLSACTILLILGLIAAPAAAHHNPGHLGGRPDRSAPGSAGQVVVAAIDSGINPYHRFFHSGGEGPYSTAAPAAVTPAVRAAFGIGSDQTLHLTRTGDMAADLAADAAQWERVERGRPYWFAGTNVIGISFEGEDAPPLKPDAGKLAHGVGVTASVLEANPSAVVVLVEGISAESEEWAFTHPAVDIVTTSYGPIGSPPLPYHLDFSYTGVVGNGKLHFGAVDNTPALSPIDTTGGPWWSIGIAGFQEDGSRGRQLVSGTAADFVGSFTQTLPYCMDCQDGRQTVSGTSFATPRSAGTVSAAVQAARAAFGHTGGIVASGERPLMVAGQGVALSNWDIRRALEEAAAYPGTGEWDPTALESDWDATSLPVLDPAPWTTTGWGLITPDPDRGVLDELLAHLTGEPTRQKSAEACTFMTALFEARYVYWNYYAFLGESWLTDADPYQRC